MQAASNNLLAGSILTKNQHGQVRGCNASDAFSQTNHLMALAFQIDSVAGPLHEPISRLHQVRYLLQIFDSDRSELCEFDQEILVLL